MPIPRGSVQSIAFFEIRGGDSGLNGLVASVAIALGSNIGDREAHLKRALTLLAEVTSVMRVSSIYETVPMYLEDQPAFLNAAILVETSLSPTELLMKLKWVETEIGRESRARYGPREIDVDLIAYGEMDMAFFDGDEEILRVPHPRLQERRFVLAPLAEIAPEFPIPGLGSVQSLLQKTNSQAASVVKLGPLQSGP